MDDYFGGRNCRIYLSSSPKVGEFGQFGYHYGETREWKLLGTSRYFPGTVRSSELCINVLLILSMNNKQDECPDPLECCKSPIANEDGWFTYALSYPHTSEG